MSNPTPAQDVPAQITAADLDKLRDTLRKIARWIGEFQDTGRTWPDGTPMSYGAAFGSNGERGYMRQVALDAINSVASEFATHPPQQDARSAKFWLFQHDETGRTACVDDFQVANGFGAANPRWKKVRELFTHPQNAAQVRDEALEEADGVCSQQFERDKPHQINGGKCDNYMTGYADGCSDCGNAIRALKSSPLPIAQDRERPSTLGEQVKAAQAEMATWSDEKVKSVRLEGGL